MNPSIIPNGLMVNTQTPLDRKVWVLTINEIKDLGIGNVKAYNYYKGLNIFCVEDRKVYIWDDVNDEHNQGLKKLLEDDFVYPLGWPEINDVVYSERSYNFFEFKSSSSDSYLIIKPEPVICTPFGDPENNEYMVSVQNGTIYQYKNTIINIEDFYIHNIVIDLNDIARIDLVALNKENGFVYKEGIAVPEGDQPTLPIADEGDYPYSYVFLLLGNIYTLNPNFDPSNYDLNDFSNNSNNPFFRLNNLISDKKHYVYDGNNNVFQVPSNEGDGHLIMVVANNVVIIDYDYDPLNKNVTIDKNWIFENDNIYLIYFKNI